MYEHIYSGFFSCVDHVDNEVHNFDDASEAVDGNE